MISEMNFIDVVIVNGDEMYWINVHFMKQFYVDFMIFKHCFCLLVPSHTPTIFHNEMHSSIFNWCDDDEILCHFQKLIKASCWWPFERFHTHTHYIIIIFIIMISTQTPTLSSSLSLPHSLTHLSHNITTTITTIIISFVTISSLGSALCGSLMKNVVWKLFNRKHHSLALHEYLAHLT